ncbi:MAG: hypothetical protein F6K09_01600 [Merismopedia sp. SIO2A8]|nr:hypothetical protein [Symploca sp. SIO2B6]NET47423.1 hypothetical protein [Merismopedia sp. SIO2A8]
MLESNSAEKLQIRRIRPKDLMEELNLKKDRYYSILKTLGIKASKDEEGKATLTQDQADAIRNYLSGNSEEVENASSASSSLVKTDDSNLATENQAPTTESSPDVYVQPEEPTAQFDVNQLVRSAAELKARELAMPDLVKRALADKMTWDDLPEDLREKVTGVQEAANPKYTPASVAETLLAQYRGGN